MDSLDQGNILKWSQPGNVALRDELPTVPVLMVFIWGMALL